MITLAEVSAVYLRSISNCYTTGSISGIPIAVSVVVFYREEISDCYVTGYIGTALLRRYLWLPAAGSISELLLLQECIWYNDCGGICAVYSTSSGSISELLFYR